MLDCTSGATAADSLARRRAYASGEVAQVQGASGEGWDIQDLLTRKTDACAPTRYKPRIACEGQLHISVAGHQTDGEGTRVSRVTVSAAGGGTVANLSPYPGPLVHGNRRIFRRLRCRRCLYLQRPTAVALRSNRPARGRWRDAAAAVSAVVAAASAVAVVITAVAAVHPCFLFSSFFRGLFAPFSFHFDHPRCPDPTSRGQQEGVPSRSYFPPLSPSPPPCNHLVPHLRELCTFNLRSRPKSSIALRKHGYYITCKMLIGINIRAFYFMQCKPASQDTTERKKLVRGFVVRPSSVGCTTIG